MPPASIAPVLVSGTLKPTFSQSTALDIIAPDTNHFDANVGWEPNTDPRVYYVGILWGNGRSQYQYRMNLPNSVTNLDIPGLDNRLPWFFTAVSVYSNNPPVTNAMVWRFAGGVTRTNYTTNYFTDSVYGNEIEVAIPTMKPWLQVNQSLGADFQFWGNSNVVYAVSQGSTPWTLQPALTITGTNGPMDYLESGTNAVFYFTVTNVP